MNSTKLLNYIAERKPTLSKVHHAELEQRLAEALSKNTLQQPTLLRTIARDMDVSIAKESSTDTSPVLSPPSSTSSINAPPSSTSSVSSTSSISSTQPGREGESLSPLTLAMEGSSLSDKITPIKITPIKITPVAQPVAEPVGTITTEQMNAMLAIYNAQLKTASARVDARRNAPSARKKPRINDSDNEMKVFEEVDSEEEEEEEEEARVSMGQWATLSLPKMSAGGDRCRTDGPPS